MAPTLVLPAELTIYTVAELKPQWLAWLREHDDEAMHADASGVTEVDAAGVQLVLSLAQTLAREQRMLMVDSPSPQFSGACRALGMAALECAQ